MVNDVADEDTRNLTYGATRLGVIVPATRVPAVFPNDVNFAGNMAEAEISTRDGGNGVRTVVYAPKVTHLCARGYSGTQEES